MAAAIAAAFALGACEKEGKLEQAGEEVDEAVDTVREGEEPASAKADDMVDEAREGVEEMKDEAKDR
jgi:hypothetical protein